jgi:hypothetical protein
VAFSVKRGALLVIVLVLAACASRKAVPESIVLADYGVGVERLELARTAYFPQAEHFSAAEALAMILYTEAAPVVPSEVGALDASVDAPALKPALLAAALKRGQVPYPLAPRLQDIVAELKAEHPVLVLLNLGSADLPAWRYAVVIGFEPATESLLLRAGTEGRVRLKPGAFLKAWHAGGDWAVVATPPSVFPATATMEKWIAASEGFSGVGKPQLAETAAQVAQTRWSDQVLPWMALGNARYHQLNFEGAQTAYVTALVLRNENPVAHHNLAQVLLERRCIDLAQREVHWAIEHEMDPKLRAVYVETEAKIKRASGLSIFCPSPTADVSVPIEYDVLPLDPDTRPAPKARKSSRRK